MNDQIVTVIAIAVVLIVALFLTKKVGFKWDKLSLSADKNPNKDKVSIKRISNSKVNIENREEQIIELEDVSENSDVKVK